MDKRTKLEFIKKEMEEILLILNKNIENQSLRNIDKDLILSKLRHMYDDFLQLETFENIKNESFYDAIPSFIDDVLERKDNVDTKVKKALDEEKVLTEHERKDEKPVSEKKSKIVIVKSKSDKEEKEEIELEPEKITEPVKPENANHPEEVNAEDDFSQNIVHKTYQHEEVKTIADKFQLDSKPTLNEILGNKQKARDLASKYTGRPIENLKASISINDKIWFIKELFDGDSDLYNDTLKKVNEMKDLDQALSYLDQNFQWDQQKDVFQSFLELLFRRFLPDQINTK